MSPKRSSPFDRDEIEKLMISAGWTARIGTNGHLVLSKDNHRNITLTDPPHRNAIAEIQTVLGLHISQLVNKRRGHPHSHSEIEKRLTLAQKMLKAGLSAKFVVDQCGLSVFFTKQATNMAEIRSMDPRELAARIYDEEMKKDGVKVTRPEPVEGFIPPLVRTAPDELRPGDINALIDIMERIEIQLDTTNDPHLSLLGTYRERSKQALIDAQEMKDSLTKALESCEHIIKRLTAAWD